MTALEAELRESEDNSMVEAGDDARDSSSGSPRMFWMFNGCIVELELSEAKLLKINNQSMWTFNEKGAEPKIKNGRERCNITWLLLAA